MQRHDFAFDLPPELIAQSPLPQRSASRMLVLDAASGSASAGSGLTDRRVSELPELLRAGDLLVLNDTRVVAARLLGSKPTGGRVEIFLERKVGPQDALAQLRASKPIRAGLQVATAGGPVQILDREDDLWRVRVPGPVLEFFERWGEVPLPPYIHRTADESDRERYQSIFARERGAVAAPTASLHFDAQLVAALQARGVERTFVTLHVGAGTFQPVRTDDLESHTMHAEQVSVSEETCAAVNRTHASGGRVVAVGTTVVRALESAALIPRAPHETGAPVARASHPSGASVSGTPLRAWAGETRLFIRPGFQFRIVDAMLTNFHLPESTLLMLVCAFAGMDNVLAAYRHAVAQRYRFFSYGDAMFLTRAESAG